jgi:hypothetical protein
MEESDKLRRLEIATVRYKWANCIWAVYGPFLPVGGSEWAVEHLAGGEGTANVDAPPP